jgi:astacin
MRTSPIPITAIIMMIASNAQASTFYPERSSPLTDRAIAALGAQAVNLRGTSFVMIDDMLLSREALRSTGMTGRRWPDARLIYDAANITPTQAELFREQCAVWERRTKIRCVARTNESGGYVIIEGQQGHHSSSTVGYPGPRSVGYVNLCCFENSRMVAHEIGHALGMAHEHVRSNRGRYISIQWKNIQEGANQRQFKRRSNIEVYGPYDFLSVMHYTQDNLSMNGLPTIIVRPPNQRYQTIIGTLPSPSELDIRGMNIRYP